MVKQSDYIGRPIEEFLIGVEIFDLTSTNDQPNENAIVIYAADTLAPLNRMTCRSMVDNGAPSAITRNRDTLYGLFGSGVSKYSGITSEAVSVFSVPVNTFNIANDGTNFITMQTGTGQVVISIHAGFTATVSSTFTLASARRIYVHRGNLYAVTGGNGPNYTITKYVGISNTVDTTLNFTIANPSGSSGNVIDGICFLGDDLIIQRNYSTSAHTQATIVRFNGFSSTVKKSNTSWAANLGTVKDFWTLASIGGNLESMRKQSGVIIPN